MLIVLSEIDTLHYLKKEGIYPDEFYMDIEFFKQNAIHFNDAYVLVIFAGMTNFKKKVVCDEISILRTRAKNKDDNGIKSVIVVSDVTLQIENYYMYQKTFTECQLKTKWTVLQNNINVIEALKKTLPSENLTKHDCTIKEAETHEDIRQRLRSELDNVNRSDDDAYIPKIKRFNVKQELEKLSK